MTGTMTAVVIDRPGAEPRLVQRPMPTPQDHEILIEISACGVCRTDLHIADGEIAARYPIVPGHEIVGRVLGLGPNATGFAIGQRVGVPWLGQSCGACPYCLSHRENLCDHPQFTGADRDGGYATHMVADARFCLAIPDRFDDAEAAPLLCAGLIGYRSLRMAGDTGSVGLYGFGAAAHIVAQVALWQRRTVYAFTRPGDAAGQDFALRLGCHWSGGSDQEPPEPLDAAIIFAPVGSLVPQALKAVKKGGRVICAGIHMSDIPGFHYADLWEERSIQSVANLTRMDGQEFLAIAAQIPIKTQVTCYRLAEADVALSAVRSGRIEGAAVLVVDRIAQT